MKQEKNSATARKILTGIMVWLIVTFFISPALFSLSIVAGLVAGFFLLRRSLLKKGILEETMVTETDENGRSRTVKRIVVHNKRVQQALHTEGERQFASGAIAGSWKRLRMLFQGLAEMLRRSLSMIRQNMSRCEKRYLHRMATRFC